MWQSLTRYCQNQQRQIQPYTQDKSLAQETTSIDLYFSHCKIISGKK